MTDIISRTGTLILAVVFLLSCCCFDTAVVFADDPDYSGEPVRLLDEECDLNSKIYDNGDHTRTLYVYAEDIKYIDESGTIRDKDITVKKYENGGYAMTDNNVRAYFPATIKDGIRLEYKKYKLITKPTADTDAEASLEDGFVVYSGDGISYRYLTLYSGIEEFTVLDNYSGISEFRYSVSTENLIPVEKDGAYYYTDSETGEVIFNVSDAVITDSEGNMSLASVYFDACDGGYILTVSADDYFLRNASYPVAIDPSYTVNTSAGIEDTTIYQGSPNLNTGSWTYNYAGYVSGYGVGRTLVRIPGLYNSTVFQSLNAAQIISAGFTIKEATGSAPQTVKLHPYYGTAWTESGATWNNTSPNSYLAAIDSESMSYGNSSTFNVLSLVRGWRTGLYTASKGFILINQNETDSGAVKALFSAETANIPYITITYENINNDVAGKTYFIRNNMSGQYIQMTSAGTVSMGNFTGELNQKWEFQDIGNGLVRIVSLSNETPTSGDHTYVLYSNFGEIVSAHYGQTPYTTYSNQCWMCVGSIGGMRLKSVNYPGKSIYQIGTNVQISDESVPVTSYWSLIECSNPYKLPEIGDQGDEFLTKYNNSDLLKAMNCYSYAVGYYGLSCDIDIEFKEMLQPGYASDRSNVVVCSTDGVHYYLTENQAEDWSDIILDNLEEDLKVIYDDEYGERKVDSTLSEDICGPWVKVALAINTNQNYESGIDYHWYIEHPDGKWSSKHGLGEATVYDQSLHYITDPGNANSRKYYPLDYDYFVGYYKIKADAVLDYIDRNVFDPYKWDVAGDIRGLACDLGCIAPNNSICYYGEIEYECNYNYLNEDDAWDNTVVNTYMWEGDVDWYEFTVTVSGYYHIQTDASTWYRPDLYGALYYGTNRLAEDDNSSLHGNFYMEVYLNAGWLYTLRVSGAYEGTYGEYRLYIS